MSNPATDVLPDTLSAPATTAPGRERLAALDVGSNSIRLLVAEYDTVAGLTVVDEVKDQPRLARGLATTGRLDQEAMDRALAGLSRMRAVCQRRGVRRIAAVATSAPAAFRALILRSGPEWRCPARSFWREQPPRTSR